MRFKIDDLDVFFPYDYVYREQYLYMVELKRLLDSGGGGVLEMPTGTGKTVSLLSLITSYQYAHPDCGNLVYCTRTVPEMTKVMEELKLVVDYRRSVTKDDKKVLGVCLSSRRNLCIHPDIVEGDREEVDSRCRSMTASFVRERAERGEPVQTCDFFETLSRMNAEGASTDVFGLDGIYTIDDLKEIGGFKGICPYYLARQVINVANVVVFNYQYLLNPKISNLITKDLRSDSIIVFDEAHNIDNVCLESMSITLDSVVLREAVNEIKYIEQEVQATKRTNMGRLKDEYNRLLHAFADDIPTQGGSATGQTVQGVPLSDLVFDEASPVVQMDLVSNIIPGSIKDAELFTKLLRYVTLWLQEKMRQSIVRTYKPLSFAVELKQELSLDPDTLQHCFSRLSSLLQTVQITDASRSRSVSLVADFLTLMSTYSGGFIIIFEPFSVRTPHAPDPTLQLVCLDASIAARPVFRRFHTVVLTSGTLTPLDMLPRLLDFQPRLRASFPMSFDPARPPVLAAVASKGADQAAISTAFAFREDVAVLRNLAGLLVQLCASVPDGVVVFFPSYAYLELAVAAWAEAGALEQCARHKLIFVETRDLVETTLALRNYRAACDSGRGGVFLSVARGKVAEGVDFDRHYGRAVLIVGLPFQYTLGLALRARLAFLLEMFQIREQDFLVFDAMRQTAQCIGRVVRSKADYGVVVLADYRYSQPSKRSKLPRWVRQCLPDEHCSLSTDAVVHLAQRYLKEMAQKRHILPALSQAEVQSGNLSSIAFGGHSVDLVTNTATDGAASVQVERLSKVGRNPSLLSAQDIAEFNVKSSTGELDFLGSHEANMIDSNISGLYQSNIAVQEQTNEIDEATDAEEVRRLKSDDVMEDYQNARMVQGQEISRNLNSSNAEIGLVAQSTVTTTSEDVKPKPTLKLSLKLGSSQAPKRPRSPH